MSEPNVGAWSEVVDDGGGVARDGSEVARDGSEVARDGSEVTRDGSEVASDDGEVSDVELSSSESSDGSDGLVTVSERCSGSDLDVPRISVSYSAVTKKNLPAEESFEEVTFRPS